MSDPIRVGVIGANPERGWALGSHLPPLQSLPEYELVAVATTRIESARETAARFNVPHAYGDPAELIADGDVDFVTVSVKVPQHYELVRAALEAGKHIFCEWPLGANSTQARELLALAESSGVHHVVGLQGRRSPIVNHTRDLVASGYVGDLLFVALSIEGGGRGGPDIPQERVWATDKANGVGALAIIGGHNIDIVRHIVGDFAEVQSTVAVRNPIATVVETGAKIDVTSPDVVIVQGRLATGAFVTITVQTGLPKGFGARLEVHGSTGVIVITGGGSLHLSDSGLALAGARGDAALEPLTVPASYQIVPDSVPDTSARNVAGLYLSIAEAIEKGDSPSVLVPNFATAVDLHRLLDEIDTAAVSGERRLIG